MSETDLNCPQCGYSIPLSEALSTQIRSQLESGLAAEHQRELREVEERARLNAQETANEQLSDLRLRLESHTRRTRDAEARELDLKRRTLELEESQRTATERIRLEVQESLRRENETRLQALLQEATARTRNEVALELKLANEQLAEERRKLTEVQENELKLRQRADALEERARSLDLELARKLDEKKSDWEAQIRQNLGEEQALKVKEREKQIDDLRRVIDDLKRKSEQGSQELQGEVLEIDVRAALERLFPHDTIASVPRGTAGADLIQTVRNGAGQACGSIVWETKNTRRWQPAWLAKLRDDQRAVSANLAVLVSVTTPAGIQSFGQVEGVWIAGLQVFPAVACALREQLIQVAFAQAAAHGKEEKMELIYNYLASDQFRQKVQGIVEAFTVLREQTERERRAMERLWKEREKQIERVITNTVGMYGEMSGILGGALQRIPALELDEEHLLEELADERCDGTV